MIVEDDGPHILRGDFRSQGQDVCDPRIYLVTKQQQMGRGWNGRATGAGILCKSLRKNLWSACVRPCGGLALLAPLTGVGGDSTVRWARQLWRQQAACGRLRTVLVEKEVPKATSPSQRKGSLPD